jgi:hypothetical protein
MVNCLFKNLFDSVANNTWLEKTLDLPKSSTVPACLGRRAGAFLVHFLGFMKVTKKNNNHKK